MSTTRIVWLDRTRRITYYGKTDDQDDKYPFVQVLRGLSNYCSIAGRLELLYDNFHIIQTPQDPARTITPNPNLLESKDSHHGKQVCK